MCLLTTECDKCAHKDVCKNYDELEDLKMTIHDNIACDGLNIDLRIICNDYLSKTASITR